MNPEQYENFLLGSSEKKIIVGVVGSRRRNSPKDLEKLEMYVLSLMRKARKSNSLLEFVSGGCNEGADYFIAGLCTRYNLPLKEHLPKIEGYFDYYKRVQAYYDRNRLIAEDCNFLLAMVAEDRKGGTENTIKHANDLGKKVILI